MSFENFEDLSIANETMTELYSEALTALNHEWSLGEKVYDEYLNLIIERDRFSVNTDLKVQHLETKNKLVGKLIIQ